MHGDSPCAQDAFVSENSEAWGPVKAAVTAALLYGVTVNDIGTLISLTVVTGKVPVVGDTTGAGEGQRDPLRLAGRPGDGFTSFEMEHTHR